MKINYHHIIIVQEEVLIEVLIEMMMMTDPQEDRLSPTSYFSGTFGVNVTVDNTGKCANQQHPTINRNNVPN